MRSFGVELEGTLSLLSFEFGGRRIPIPNGFRAELKLLNKTRYCSLHFPRDFLFPGESEEVVIKALTHNDDRGLLLSEKEVGLFEGPIKIGVISNIKLIAEYPVE